MLLRRVALIRRATFSSFRTTKFFTMLLFARVWDVFCACQKSLCCGKRICVFIINGPNRWDSMCKWCQIASRCLVPSVASQKRCWRGWRFEHVTCFSDEKIFRGDVTTRPPFFGRHHAKGGSRCYVGPFLSHFSRHDQVTLHGSSTMFMPRLNM